MIGDSFIGQYRLSNRQRHSIVALLSIVIVGALALGALSLRSSSNGDDSVRAGISLPEDEPPAPGATATTRSESGRVAMFSDGIAPASSSTTGPRPRTPVSDPPSDPHPSSTIADQSTTTQPAPEPEPKPTITWVTVPNPTVSTWITIPGPTVVTRPIPTTDTTVPSTGDTTMPSTWETTIPTTWDVTVPTLPPEPKPGKPTGR